MLSYVIFRICWSIVQQWLFALCFQRLHFKALFPLIFFYISFSLFVGSFVAFTTVDDFFTMGFTKSMLILDINFKDGAY